MLITAAQVPLRVEPAVLYAAPFLILRPNAEHFLNGLQVAWARISLECQAGPHIQWSVLVAQAGWSRRLGTRMLERAIMSRARASLLPLSQSTHGMLASVDAVPAPSWVSVVRRLMSGERLPSFVLDIILDVFDHSRIELARTDRVV